MMTPNMVVFLHHITIVKDPGSCQNSHEHLLDEGGAAAITADRLAPKTP